MFSLPAPFRSPSLAVAGPDPFFELHRQMNRLFDDFLGGGTSLAPAVLASAPRLDVRDDAREISVCAELPGVKPEEVEVRVEGNMLTLRGEKSNEAEQKEGDYYLMERSYGRFQRSVQLPFAPDPAQVRADFEHGVLTIHVPKQPEQEKSRRVEIQSSSGAQPLQARVTAPGADQAGAGIASAGSGAGTAQPHH